MLYLDTFHAFDYYRPVSKTVIMTMTTRKFFRYTRFEERIVDERTKAICAGMGLNVQSNSINCKNIVLAIIEYFLKALLLPSRSFDNVDLVPFYDDR